MQLAGRPRRRGGQSLGRSRNASGDMVRAPSMKRVTMTPVCRIDMDHLGADAGVGRLARRDRLVGAVDVFLGALARQPHTVVADAKHEIGQAAEPLDRADIAVKHRDGGRGWREAGLRFHHPWSSPLSALPEYRCATVPQRRRARLWLGRRRCNRQGGDDERPGQDGAAGTVYRRGSPEELAQVYDAWAENYDADMSKVGYRHPAIWTGDAGPPCAKGRGTAARRGRRHRPDRRMAGDHGLSRCRGARSLAGHAEGGRTQGVYSALHRAALGGTCLSDDRFAAIISAGVFTTGHVGVEGSMSSSASCRRAAPSC